MQEHKYRLEVPPLRIEKRGTRGSLVIGQVLGDMVLQHQVRIEDHIFKAMSPAQLKKVRKMVDEEIKRRIKPVQIKLYVWEYLGGYYISRNLKKGKRRFGTRAGAHTTYLVDKSKMIYGSFDGPFSVREVMSWGVIPIRETGRTKK